MTESFSWAIMEMFPVEGHTRKGSLGHIQLSKERALVTDHVTSIVCRAS